MHGNDHTPAREARPSPRLKQSQNRLLNRDGQEKRVCELKEEAINFQNTDGDRFKHI